MNDEITSTQKKASFKHTKNFLVRRVLFRISINKMKTRNIHFNNLES